MKRQRWTQEQVEEFRAWHHELINRLYKPDPALIKELARNREKFLKSVEPRG